MLFDSHAHYDDQKFDEDRDQVIQLAHDRGVSFILNAATDISTAKSSIALAEKFEFVYAAAGLHPHNVKDVDSRVLDDIRSLAAHPKVVAIGEIGLDYYYDFSPREEQQKWLRMQLALAKELKMPVILHDRDSHEDILRIVKEEKSGDTGGVFHCFSGSVEMAKEVLRQGFMISVGGPVTFKNARKVIEVVEYVPDDRLLIETDSPYLSPEPYRGKRNDSAHVLKVAEKIALIKGQEVEVVAAYTLENAKRLFSIA